MDLTNSVDHLNASPYQQSSNTTGFLTANVIGHVQRFEPCLNAGDPRTTIYDAKALPLVMQNPLPRHDTYVTTNQQYHQGKFYEDRYEQPRYPLPLPQNRIDFIRPDFVRRVRDAHGLNPINDTSETRDQFRARRRDFDMYGPPLVFTPTRDVFVRSYADYVYPFDPAENSVLKASHTYMTTNMMVHRAFPKHELEHYAMLTAIDDAARCQSDVAIKLRVRPMHDPFEQKLVKLDIHPCRDAELEAGMKPSLKSAFRRPLYTGCPPRSFLPVEHLGGITTYTDKFSNPWHPNNKENNTSEVQFCYIRPRGVSLAGEKKVPNMYTTETMVYGNGRGTDAYVRVEKLNDRINPKYL